MRFVVKHLPTGRYMRGERRWTRAMDPDINKAKMFHRYADALCVIVSEHSRRSNSTDWTVVAVTVSEAPPEA